MGSRLAPRSAGHQVRLLGEPAYNAKIWDELAKSDNPKQATAYPTVAVHVGANTKFVASAPKVADFLKKYETTGDLVSNALAYMQENNATADQAARNFLKTRADVWSKWVPADVAGRVKAAAAG